MSEHSSHETPHDEHAGHSHGEEAHGEHWGDYNAKPPDPSILPPVHPLGLAILGIALAVLLAVIVSASFSLSVSREAPSRKPASEHAE